MDKKKSQHYNFCYDVIPPLFHSQTEDFFTYLERDGLKFLEFWWKHVGTHLPTENLVSFASASYEIMHLESKPPQRVVFLHLPPPQADGEMYFLAMIAKPERRFGWLRLPTTRILCLVKRSLEKYPNKTELGDLTPRGLYVPIEAGPSPSFGEFKRKVLDMIQPKPAA